MAMNLNILPFYESISEQNRFSDIAYGEKFALFTPDRKVLPFQIYIKDKIYYPEDIVVKLHRLEDNSVQNITQEMSDKGLSATNLAGNNIIVAYSGQVAMNISTPPGEYYLEFIWGQADPSDSEVHLYSEVFTIRRKLDDMLKLSYRSHTDIEYTGGKIDFESDKSFKFNLYLPTGLFIPEYPIQEEGIDRDGYFFVKKQISEKVYKFNFLTVEFICDALRIVRLMEDVTVEWQGKTIQVERFLSTVNWQAGSFWAAVDVELHSDTVVKKTGSLAPAATGDFNDDFSNDYDK